MDDEFDLEDFLPYLLNQAAERASDTFRRAYRDRYGMLRTEWRVLFHLGQFGPMTAREICSRAHLHKTKVSRAVAALAERRHLTRSAVKGDRRQELLALTPAGEAVFADLRRLAAEHDRQLTEVLPPAEQAALRGHLRRLAGL